MCTTDGRPSLRATRPNRRRILFTRPCRASDVGALPHRNRVGRNDNPPSRPARRQSPCSRAARLSSVPAALHAAPGVALFRCLLRWCASVLLVPRGGCHGRPPLSPRRRPPYPFRAGRVFSPERACGRGRPSSSPPLPVSSLDRTFPVGLPPPPPPFCVSFPVARAASAVGHGVGGGPSSSHTGRWGGR